MKTPRRPLLVGLTGGIGSGKSAALAEFARRGAATLSLDELAHEVSGLAPAERKALAAKVFSDPKALRRLERALHPPVLREMARRLARARGLTVVDVPLLFEKKLEDRFDVTLAVTAGLKTRLARLARRGTSPAEARRRMKAQLPAAEHRRRADLVIDNGGSRKDLTEKVRQYHAALQSIAVGGVK